MFPSRFPVLALSVTLAAEAVVPGHHKERELPHTHDEDRSPVPRLAVVCVVTSTTAQPTFSLPVWSSQFGAPRTVGMLADDDEE
jgi:hypothetical protein